MAEHKIPDGIVRSISIVTCGDAAYDGVVLIYVDGIRKYAEIGESTSALDLADIIENEGCNGKVIHVQKYTCDTFLEDVCLGDIDRCVDLAPELLQHLKVD